MKRFLLIAILSLFVSYAPAQDLLRSAEKAYDSRNYPEAIKNYEKLINAGYRSYQLYFNLGNAYYRNNQLGKSIYYYELARKSKPGDEDVRINLAIASSKTIDKIEAKENFFISAVKSNLLTSFTTNTWAWLSVAGIALFALFFFGFISSEVVQLKRIFFVLGCLFFVFFICSYALGYSALKARYENKFAVVLAKEVGVMNEPTEMAKTKFKLHEGTKIRVVENNGDWLLIKLDNGNEGWMKLTQAGII
jgi:tetratricopeptide (TPR) repeat protein